MWTSFETMSRFAICKMKPVYPICNIELVKKYTKKVVQCGQHFETRSRFEICKMKPAYPFCNIELLKNLIRRLSNVDQF